MVLILGGAAVLGLAMLLVDPLFFIAGLVALLVAGAVLSNPYYGVILYLALLYIRPGDIYPQLEPLRLTMLGVTLLTVAFVLQVLVYRRVKAILTMPMIFMGLVLAAILLSMPGSYYRTLSMTRFTDSLRLVFMTYLIVHLIDSVSRLRGFMTALVLILAGLSSWLVSRFFLMPYTRVDNGGSGGVVGGFLGDGNDFALAQNVVLPWAIALIPVTSSRFWRWLLIYSVAIGALAVGCTFSRGGFLGLLALVVAFYIHWIVRTQRYVFGVFTALIGVTLLLAALFAFAPEDFLDRMTSIKDYEEDESARGRLDAWQAGFRMFSDRPFFGVGAGAFNDAYGKKYKPTNAVAANWREAHSVYIQVMGEMGLFGLLAVFGLVFVLWRSVFRLRFAYLADPDQDRFFHIARSAVYGSLCAWMVSGAFLSVAFYPHLYLLVMITACLERLARYHSAVPLTIEEIEED